MRSSRCSRLACEGRACFGGQSGEAQWSSVKPIFLTSFERVECLVAAGRQTFELLLHMRRMPVVCLCYCTIHFTESST